MIENLNSVIKESILVVENHIEKFSYTSTYKSPFYNMLLVEQYSRRSDVVTKMYFVTDEKKQKLVKILTHLYTHSTPEYYLCGDINLKTFTDVKQEYVKSIYLDLPIKNNNQYNCKPIILNEDEVTNLDFIIKETFDKIVYKRKLLLNIA